MKKNGEKIMKRKILSFIPLILITLNLNLAFAITTATVQVSPDSTNQYGSYTISAALEGGGFFGTTVEANEDFLYVVFDSSTVVPSSIDHSLVTVNGVASNGVTTVGDTIKILSPVELTTFFLGDPNFTIVISAAAKVRSPSTTGDYNLQLGAINSDDTLLDGYDPSDNYTIYTSGSTISPPAVAPGPTQASQSAAYTVTFNVGTGGFLTSGIGTITIAFDTSTTVPSGALSGVTVNSTSATAVASNDTVVITTPVDIDNESSASINFSTGSGLQNPSTGGNYVLDVKTSSENTFVESDSFSIANIGDF